MNCHWKLRRHVDGGEYWTTGSGRHQDSGIVCKRCGKRVRLWTTRDPIGLAPEFYRERRQREEMASLKKRIAALESRAESQPSSTEEPTP